MILSPCFNDQQLSPQNSLLENQPQVLQEHAGGDLLTDLTDTGQV